MAGYTSPYGPKMRPQFNVAGLPLKNLIPTGMTAAVFGGAALVAVIFLGEGIPRMQDDVLKRIPLVNQYYLSKKPTPASDNPF
ncbi:cytochrome b-c1 complex subunit 10 [Tricharina praecox]|uniref:cytochrome b-c1 complex subunit 10 n=1 Tax=Tricharina praecox TaxID=43433 RepID=UPI00221E85DE|nr:cytochrome b-c1 complex subunit 10 [Tricharina praecox]KAI5845382.1 cytochrome b-c1 complex subunit 10 [Tricharina praecox]